MGLVIKTDGIGKSYHIVHERGPRYLTLRETLTEFLTGLGRRRVRSEAETFWALRDVDLEIREGERVGIIGQNGAGKSTLMKLLSRITEPSAGRMRLNGRVASLLEVGTGFHPELSGRENIYLNGALLGMSRRDIRRRFDEIVSFAGVERFLDTPVKRYSSGMYTRLAFSVAAHLESDILLVDEVLAVGDAAFQKKCLSAMASATESGRTVLFISHNMNAVEQLCGRAVWLDGGRVVEDSTDVRTCIRNYLAGSFQHERPSWKRVDGRFDTPELVPLQLYLADDDGTPRDGSIANDEEVCCIVEVDVKRLDPGLCIGLAMYSMEGELLYWSYQTDIQQARWPLIQLGRNKLSTVLPQHMLNEGDYRIEMIASLHFREWYLQPGKGNPAFSFTVQGGLSSSPYWTARRPGLLAPILKWKSQPVSGDDTDTGVERKA